MLKQFTFLSLFNQTLGLLLAGLSTSAMAQNLEPTLDCTKLTISGTAKKMVPNDNLTLRFYTEETSTDAAKLQTKNLSALNDTVKQLKKMGLDTSLESQSIRPVFNSVGKLSGAWTFTGSFYVSTTDFLKINEVLPELLKAYKLQNTTYSISDTVKEKELAQLRLKAVTAYNENAKTIATAFNANKITYLDIAMQQEGFDYIPAPMYMAKSMAFASAGAPAEISDQSTGQSTLKYTISGTIGLNCH